MSDPSRSACSASSRRGWIVGGVGLVAIVGLSLYYFTLGSTIADIRRQWSAFYPTPRPGWAQLKPSEIGYAFNNNPDMWTTLVVRTAYGRWRVRNAVPEAFTSIMNDYAHGWWLSPSRETWENIFSRFDNEWLEKRRETLKTANGPTSKTEEFKAKLRVVYERPNEGMLVLRFPGRPHTYEAGSCLRLVVDVFPKDIPTQPVKIYWETERAIGMAPQRRRLATLERIEGAPAGKQRIAIEADLSWEPQWMFVGSVIRGIHVRAPGTTLSEWEPVNVEFLDSQWFDIEDRVETDKSG